MSSNKVNGTTGSNNSNNNDDNDDTNNNNTKNDNGNSQDYKWTAHRDDDDAIYYYNEETGESAWDPPDEGYHDPEDLMSGGSDNNNKSNNNTNNQNHWTKHTNDEGIEYYYNEDTGETTWDKPDDYVDDELDDNQDNGTSDEHFHAGEEENNNNKKKNQPLQDMDMDNNPSSPTMIEKEDGNDDEEVESSKDKWTSHKDDEGRVYFYNEITGETTWDKPDGMVSSPDKIDDDDNDDDDASSAHAKNDDDDDDANKSDASTDFNKFNGDRNDDDDDDNDEDEYEGSSPIQQSPDMGTADTPEHDDADPPENGSAAAATATTTTLPVVSDSKWSKHLDDEGREYYYNELTQETQWDKPDDFVEISKWSRHYDDEGREYYYNETSGETSWDMPPGFEEEDKVEDHGLNKSMLSITTNDAAIARAKMVDVEPVEKQPLIQTEPEPEPEPEIDPVLKRIQDAENALNQPDAIMEPNCLDNVRQLISGGGNEGGAKAMQSLLSSFKGETAICGILGLWLADLKKADEQAIPEPDKAVDDVRDIAQHVIDKIAKDRFTKAGGDNIFQLKKAEAGFLEDMMESSLWRKLLIDLSATHRDSTLLSYCLSSISKRGHHREIAKRINQSDHFPVYSSMLTSEFTIVGNGGDSTGIHALVEDLRRSCTSTSYTYLYAVEFLRHLVQKAEDQATTDPSLSRAIRKWTRLREELENAMVDPTVSAKTAGASTLYRKRRRDVALTISELTQRQRRRLRPGIDENRTLRDEERDALESALSNLLLRHAEGKMFDDHLLDQLLVHGRNPKQLGRLMNSHPLAIKALLGHLFLPGALRTGSLSSRAKCARLIALAVLAAEAATKTERGFEDPTNRQAREEEIKGCLLTGSQMCELVENMVSFVVSSDTEVKDANPSAGIKLSVLANKSAPVAEGVVMWAKELVSGNEFVSAASYPTLAPSMLSLVRVVSTRHPFTRPLVLEVALTFLGHSNSEMTYQKMNEIKEQALRVMFFLLVQGEVTSVLGKVVNLLESNGVNLDSSLARYFVSGLLDIVSPPCSPIMVTAMGKLLLSPKCIEALQSAYFPDEKKNKLKTLISMIRLGLSDTKGEVLDTIEALRKTYV
ncbi:TH1 protein [Fragilaria crotonensis]|nr:TH1 protein [Fragilaria crotonensis]